MPARQRRSGVVVWEALETRAFLSVGTAGSLAAFPSAASPSLAALVFSAAVSAAVSVPTRTLVPTPAPASHITWRTGAPSPIARAEAVGASAGGKLYIFGGFGNVGSVHGTIPLSSRCDVYDPAANKWTRLRDFPEPFTHAQGAVWGTDIWFAGGYVGNHPGPGTTHVWVYHTTSDTWTRGPNLPTARGAGGSAIIGHTLYFVGGMNGARLVDDGTGWALDLNHPSTGWKPIASMPNPRNHIATVALKGFLYALGGQHGQEDAEKPQSSVDRYDPATNRWTAVANLPVPLAHVTAGSLAYNGKILVIGGEGNYGKFLSKIYSYDPASNKWAVAGTLPAPRGAVVAGIINGRIVTSTGNGPVFPANRETWIGTFSR